MTQADSTNRIVKYRTGAAVALLALGFAMGSCEMDGWDELEPIEVQHALSASATCDDLQTYAVEAASQLMRTEVEIARNRDLEQSKNGGPIPNAIDFSDGEADEADDDSDDGSGADYSETNVQEKGVDEADLVKTDGTYIYALHSGELVIVRAGAEGEVTEAGRADVGGYAQELFIYDNLAVVFSRLTAEDVPAEIHYYQQQHSWDTPDDYCLYEWCYGSGEYSQIAFVDVTSREAPTVLRTIVYAGTYETSRRIDNTLHVVFYSPLPALEMIWEDSDFYDENWWTRRSKINRYYRNLIEKNDDRFRSLTLDDILPKKVDSVDGQARYIVPCDKIWGSLTPTGIGLTSVASFDLAAPTAPDFGMGVFGEKGLVYATPSSLYLTTSSSYVINAAESGLWSEETSGVHKFDLTAPVAPVTYRATGAVPGRLLDQFCLGEKDGYLRLATTTGLRWEVNDLESHVFVLAEQGPALSIVGRLDGLGLGEEIYAARFLGDRGFIVTFFQQDPLYTLNLADPFNPVVVGEWHGPGYSTYLHPIGENRLLSIGLEDWQPAISLYDVSNFALPTLVSRLFLDGDSEAVNDHRAFTFNEETGFLALPYWGYGNMDNWISGVRTYRVSADGIVEGGMLQMQNEQIYDEGAVRRSLYIGDYLYGLSRCRVTSGLLDDPSPIASTLELFTAGSCDDYGYWDVIWEEF